MIFFGMLSIFAGYTLATLFKNDAFKNIIAIKPLIFVSYLLILLGIYSILSAFF